MAAQPAGVRSSSQPVSRVAQRPIVYRCGCAPIQYEPCRVALHVVEHRDRRTKPSRFLATVGCVMPAPQLRFPPGVLAAAHKERPAEAARKPTDCFEL